MFQEHQCFYLALFSSQRILRALCSMASVHGSWPIMGAPSAEAEMNKVYFKTDKQKADKHKSSACNYLFQFLSSSSLSLSDSAAITTAAELMSEWNNTEKFRLSLENLPRTA